MLGSRNENARVGRAGGVTTFCYIARMNDPRPKNLTEALDPVIERVERRQWQNNAVLSLGGAGASVAVLLVAFQLIASKSTQFRTLSMYFAAFAIPIWVCLWQMSDTTEFWGDHGLKVSARPLWAMLGVGLFSSGSVLLGLSLAALIAEVSSVSIWFLALLWVVVIVVVMTHAHAVKKNAPRSGTPPTSAKLQSNTTGVTGGGRRRKR